MPPTALSAFHLSPKRKRDQPIPLLNTALRPASPPPNRSPSPDSPRNAVADQLRGMTLASVPAIPMSPLTPTDDVVRKKPKLEERKVDIGTSLEQYLGDLRAKGLDNGQMGNTIAVNVVELDSREPLEAPQAHTQPRTSSSMVSFAHQPTAFVSSASSTLSQYYSPTSAPMQKSRSKDRTAQPRQRKKSPSPPLSLSPLTWQENEITGHLAGPSTDPDDDGTGLNGIGFRPTPAIAYARAQRRRQQVLDWKAREAREARAKRSERRRRGVGGNSSREATVERDVVSTLGVDVARRTVKFAV